MHTITLLFVLNSFNFFTEAIKKVQEGHTRVYCLLALGQRPSLLHNAF